MNTDAKPMFLVNGVSPLPFSSGWTGRICREMDIQGMVKTQRHQKHSAYHYQQSTLIVRRQEALARHGGPEGKFLIF